MAKAAVDAGSDALSLINTLTGMKIDIERRDFVLANKTGGMSGPAIKPVAVRMVYQVANAVDVPIIGMGGISTAEEQQTLSILQRHLKWLMESKLTWKDIRSMILTN